MTDQKLVTLKINDRDVQVPPGTLVIEATRRIATEVPSFCYYPGLSLQAACRMCLVEVEKMPKLQTACTLVATEGMVVMDEDTCMVDMARRIMHFYAHESCGWCIPCREGTAWLKKMLDRFHAGAGREEDIPLIDELSKNMLGRTFCPLGDAAALPTISIVQKWRNEFEDHLNGKCAYNAADMIEAAR